MPMTLEQLAAEALALPNEEWVILAERVAESLDNHVDREINSLWTSEAKRRRDEVRSGQVQTIPGEEALAQVRRSLGR